MTDRIWLGEELPTFSTNLRTKTTEPLFVEVSLGAGFTKDNRRLRLIIISFDGISLHITDPETVAKLWQLAEEKQVNALGEQGLALLGYEGTARLLKHQYEQGYSDGRRDQHARTRAFLLNFEE